MQDTGTVATGPQAPIRAKDHARHLKHFRPEAGHLTYDSHFTRTRIGLVLYINALIKYIFMLGEPSEQQIRNTHQL